MSSVRFSLLLGIGLVVLTLFAYGMPPVPFLKSGNIWENEFINLDDDLFIRENEHVLNGLTLADLHWAFTTWQGASWIPLTWMSFQLDADLSAWLRDSSDRGEPLPWVFHGQNLFWHTATVLLLFWVLRRMTGAVWRSALVAALFAVHPLHVESVAWATERKDVLSTFFWVLAILLYVRWAERPSWGRYLLVVLAFSLGLMAKPMLLTFPFTLLLLDIWPLGRWNLAGSAARSPQALAPRPLKQLVWEKLPLFAITAAATAFTIITQSPVDQLYHQPLPFPDRLANALASYGWYLEKTFWPTNLALFYCHPLRDWQWPAVLAGGAVLVAGTVLALSLLRRWPWVLVGWLWFLGTLVPVIGLLQVGWQARADRYAYVPHIGLFLALVWSLAALKDKLRLPAWPLAGLAAGGLVVLACTTRIQLAVWHDSETVWEHTLAVTTNNHLAHCDLGRFLFKKAEKTGDATLLSRARPHFEQAIALQPNDSAYHSAFSLVLMRLEDYREAAEQLKQALRLDPKVPGAWHTLGSAQFHLGQYQEAVVSLRRELESSPDDAETRAELGLALWRLHQEDEAEQELCAALRRKPELPDALNGLGLVRLKQGRNQDALDLFRQACQINPLLIEAYSNQATALERLGNKEEARICREMAAQLEEIKIRNRKSVTGNATP